jgi:hypothetical protein
MNMYKGGCLCDGIRFEISGPINNIVFCHCSQCRKVQGSAFATNGVVEKDAFRLVKGEELLLSFEGSPGKRKYFCRQCGSPIYSDNTDLPDVVRVRLGTIESEITERPECHIFVASKANWDEITDDLPQFDAAADSIPQEKATS